MASELQEETETRVRGLELERYKELKAEVRIKVEEAQKRERCELEENIG